MSVRIIVKYALARP